MQNYLDYMRDVLLKPLSNVSSTRFMDFDRKVLSVGSGAHVHAGGAGLKSKVAASVDGSIESTGTDSGATVAASDDDEGDGDGDPDSDRRKLSKQLTSKSGAIIPPTKSLNTEYKRREAQEIQMTKVPASLLPQTGFIRLPKVLSTIPVSKSTWWAGIKSGKYPAGVKLSERVTAWRVEDIHALINQLASNAS